MTSTTPARSTWTGPELMAAQFPAPVWVVPGIVPEGIMLVGAPPKAGKSWWVLEVAVSVAGGTHAFGSLQVDQGDVLYAAVEETPRRMQARLGTVLGVRPAPPGLTIRTELPGLDEGGVRVLSTWLDEHPRARLIILDVWAKVAPSGGTYSAEYRAIGTLRKLIGQRGIAVILVHHALKSSTRRSSVDWIDSIRGSGLTGAVDTVAVLERGRADHEGTLRVAGRDVDEIELPMTFDAGRWILAREQANQLSDIRAQILGALREGALSPAELAVRLGRDPNTVRQRLFRMAQDGQIVKVDGRYSVRAAA